MWRRKSGNSRIRGHGISERGGVRNRRRSGRLETVWRISGDQEEGEVTL